MQPCAWKQQQPFYWLTEWLMPVVMFSLLLCRGNTECLRRSITLSQDSLPASWIQNMLEKPSSITENIQSADAGAGWRTGWGGETGRGSVFQLQRNGRHFGPGEVAVIRLQPRSQLHEKYQLTRHMLCFDLPPTGNTEPWCPPVTALSHFKGKVLHFLTN